MLVKFKADNSRCLLALSFVLSVMTITGAILVNVQIAERYENATGKTRALFGVIELTYGYKYYLAIVGLLATALGIIAARRGQRQYGLLAIMSALAAVVLVFLRFWTLMVDSSE